MKKNLTNLRIETLEDLKIAKSNFLNNDLELKQLMNDLKLASKEQKASIGQKINFYKQEIEQFFLTKKEEIEKKEVLKKIQDEFIDVFEEVNFSSSLHPLTLIENRFRTWFLNNGYYETEGSEITTDKINFELLNIPKDHPSRDMQDSLYLEKEQNGDQLLLRTHNTGFSIIELIKNKNKAFSAFSIGKVYRNDEDDNTHSHQFSQVDVIVAGKYNFPNLMWLLKSLLSYVFEEEVKIRLRPSYFPFTEPSCEVDVFYKNKWIEVLGSGIIHENVMKAAGYTNDMNALAWGIGIERIAMIKYGIDNIREFYKNDIRFLKQFNLEIEKLEV
ncbi:phenylalanine--tRNA ligase subunit alpha [[Mycoplasma] mobile]|uniref:phenylalanine--tRNA ligase n=1 Tax=Mycoplasma mobile (strain ATCC 43663 / 163K / NCTC 11711) TaxID=267748 RepID=Q6KHX3_MYCM1|nr:phenylalanine--tRNA ligase subunit alpha [[Mycoplasma] mobile]AAT27803.1 phenylalanyl-tRNA synthetase alpha subunit [Mycoplasma mobile 163K]